MQSSNHHDLPVYFIPADGQPLPMSLICSGQLADVSCPYAVNGRMPNPQPLDKHAPDYSKDKGQAGDLCPPCVRQHLSNLGHWQGHGGAQFPEQTLGFRLFKCRRGHWVVVDGLYHDTPAVLNPSETNVMGENP